MSTKHKIRNKILIVLISLFCIVLILCFLYNLIGLIIQPSNIFVVEEGKIYQEETTYGYIIRNEKVLYGENYKNGLVEIASEGTKVSKGENVFRYYSNNEENLKKQIANLDIEIQEALEGQKEGYSADIQLLDKQIEDYLGKLLLTNNIVDIEEYRTNISDVLIKKAKIAGELSPSGSHISSLIEQRRTYEEQLNGGQEYISTDTSGIVSYKIDGLEDELKPENFDNLTKKILESYNLKTGQMIPTSSEAGKIVDNFECYIVVFLDSDEAKNAKEGDKINLRLSDSTIIDAEIKKVSQDESGDTMIIFRTNKSVEDLISYRKISVDVIWWSYEGLKVPNTALFQEGDLYYVIRNRAGYNDKIFVKVIKQNKNYSIIENYGIKELIEKGISEEEANSMKNIFLYDEISISIEE